MDHFNTSDTTPLVPETLQDDEEDAEVEATASSQVPEQCRLPPAVPEQCRLHPAALLPQFPAASKVESIVHLGSSADGPGSWPASFFDTETSKEFLQQPGTSFLPGLSEVAIDRQSEDYVRTRDLDEAFDILEDKGRVVLCGPPGSGKTTTAHALLRGLREQQYEACVFSEVKDWQSHVSESKRTAVLMDGTLGEVRVDPDQYRQWRSMLGSILPMTEQGHCKLIVTLYPHILKELMQMEGEFSSPVLDKMVVVKLTNELSMDVKEKMLNYHLAKLCLEPSLQREVVESILHKDVSGPAFPWCCRYMTEHWHMAHNPTDIFVHPAESFVALLKRMLKDQRHGPSFAAVFALTMKGLGGFLHEAERIQPHLQQLRFDNFCEYHLAEYADLLQGSILSASEYAFASRVEYDATGMAFGKNPAGFSMGQAFSMPVLLQVCDTGFLVKYLRITADTRQPFTVYIGSQPNIRAQYMRRVFDDVVRGHLPELCQHPELCSIEFQAEFEAFCGREKKNLQQFVTSIDTVHSLPLLYWSTWGPSDQLTKWCLDIIYRSYFFRKVPTESCLSSALICVLFTQPASVAKGRAKVFAEELLKVVFNFTKAEEICEDSSPTFIEFPYPDNLLSEDSKSMFDRLSRLVKQPALVPFSPDVHRPVIMSENAVNVKMTKSAWSWLVLAAARGMEGAQNEKASPPDPTMIAPVLGSSNPARIGTARAGSFRSSLSSAHFRTMSENKIVYYAPRDLHAAIKNGRFEDVQAYLCAYKCATLDDSLSNNRTPLHTAVGYGQYEIAQLLLLLGADVNAKTFLSNETPLHVACSAGDVKMVQLLLEHGADVNMAGFGGYFPLHRACMLGNVAITELLISSGASVNISTQCGEHRTALHLACFHGHADVIEFLVLHEADITAKTREGLSPMDVARKKGMSNVINLMIKLSQNARESAGDTNTSSNH